MQRQYADLYPKRPKQDRLDRLDLLTAEIRDLNNRVALATLANTRSGGGYQTRGYQTRDNPGRDHWTAVAVRLHDGDHTAAAAWVNRYGPK